MNTTPNPLPIRIAHPPKPQLEHLDDAYFELLVKCGCQGLYLQDSPFDAVTGNHGAFKKQFHLIYLYDIAYGPERQRYRDYINEVCRRAARHGLETHLCCWEPRLPFNAWGETPVAWRGRGGFYYAGRMNVTSFCWSEPEAVAYWKQMALDAFAALPEIAGVHLGVVDNEANFCDESCPKCGGRTQAQQMTPLRMTAGTRLHVACRRFNAKDESVHENDYLFASNEDAAPFGAEMPALIRGLFERD